MPATQTKTPAISSATSRKYGERPAASPELIQKEIRERAQKIAQKRNGGPGDALSDWLQAEKEVKAKFQSA